MTLCFGDIIISMILSVPKCLQTSSLLVIVKRKMIGHSLFNTLI